MNQPIHIKASEYSQSLTNFGVLNSLFLMVTSEFSHHLLTSDSLPFSGFFLVSHSVAYESSQSLVASDSFIFRELWMFMFHSNLRIFHPILTSDSFLFSGLWFYLFYSVSSKSSQSLMISDLFHFSDLRIFSFLTVIAFESSNPLLAFVFISDSFLYIGSWILPINLMNSEASYPLVTLQSFLSIGFWILPFVLTPSYELWFLPLSVTSELSFLM